MQDQNPNIPSYDGPITKQQFAALQELFDHFNTKLFKGELRNCLLNFSRKSKAMGFYSPKRWAENKDTSVKEGTPKVLSIDEISLNPDYLHLSTKEYCQTLVHEMCHLWQHHFGKPTAGYHNKEWANKMKEVGLQPSHNGQPGGKETGKSMADYAIPAGVFELTYEAIPAEMLLPFIAFPDMEKKKKQKKKNKIKYTCPDCNSNVWAKPNMRINCGDCSDGEENIVQYFPQESETNEEEEMLAELVGVIN